MFKNTLVAAAAIAFLFAGSASAQKLDANGKCHDASGKFAKAEVCGGASAKTAKSAGAASATAAAKPAAATAKSASTKCKNDKGKYAKCGTPGAHPA